MTRRVSPYFVNWSTTFFAKEEELNKIAAAHNLQADDFIAVGDGANDLGMLKTAGTGVALHAKPAVAEQADIRVDHGDLTALLYLQGYKYSEFSKWNLVHSYTLSGWSYAPGI